MAHFSKSTVCFLYIYYAICRIVHVVRVLCLRQPSRNSVRHYILGLWWLRGAGLVLRPVVSPSQREYLPYFARHVMHVILQLVSIQCTRLYMCCVHTRRPALISCQCTCIFSIREKCGWITSLLFMYTTCTWLV